MMGITAISTKLIELRSDNSGIRATKGVMIYCGVRGWIELTRFTPQSNFRFLMHASLFLTLVPHAEVCTAQLVAPGADRAVEIRQLQEVKQGGAGWFEVKIRPEEKHLSVTLRLRRFPGTGAASFENGSDEYRMAGTGEVQIYGVVASDLAGGMALTAWIDGEGEPAAIAFFDVIAPRPNPRIFWGAQDITGTTQSAVVGQQVLLNVTLHPSLAIRSENWTIEPEGEYVGGFVHTPARGGPQPVSLRGPTTTIYWVRPGSMRKVTYQVIMDDGERATASAVFDVDGPLLRDVIVPPVEVIVGHGAERSSSYMSFAGAGISFRAQYSLPEGMMRNYTWVQVVTRDVMEVNVGNERKVCTPVSQPEAELGVGLDTNYPYDWRNPTRDSPPMQLLPQAETISRHFHARMYLLWGSGLSNSIVVPLGYVGWHFEGFALRKDLLTNSWTLKEGRGGADDPEQPYRPTRSYPLWNAVVPYLGEMQCK